MHDRTESPTHPLTHSPAHRLLPFAAAFLLLCGCASPLQQRDYPIGIYGVPSTADFSEVRAAGFNLVVGPATREYLDAARLSGLKVLATPPDLSRTTRHRLPALDSHPNLWAWYLIDEPDLNTVPPREVVRRQRQLRLLGARKPTALTLYQGAEALDYGNITDILMLDRYPIPWLPLANFGQHLRMARLAVGQEKPLIAVLQAFDWTAYPGMIGKRKLEGLRPPNYQELRCMVYEALARGANGLFFYEFDGTWKIRDHPEVWNSLKSVVREVNEREPLFRARRLWWAKNHEFADPAQGFNAALESSVTSTLLQVLTGNDRIPPGHYILAVNNTLQELEYSFSLPDASVAASALRATEVQVLDENRSVTPSENRITDKFAPYAIHVYGPLQ